MKHATMIFGIAALLLALGTQPVSATAQEDDIQVKEIKPFGYVRRHRTTGQHVQVDEVVLRIESEVVVTDVASAHDREGEVHRPGLVVHPPVEMLEVDDELGGGPDRVSA